MLTFYKVMKESYLQDLILAAIPPNTGVREVWQDPDSGSHRKDSQGLLQEAPG